MPISGFCPRFFSLSQTSGFNMCIQAQKLQPEELGIGKRNFTRWYTSLQVTTFISISQRQIFQIISKEWGTSCRCKTQLLPLPSVLHLLCRIMLSRNEVISVYTNPLPDGSCRRNLHRKEETIFVKQSFASLICNMTQNHLVKDFTINTYHLTPPIRPLVYRPISFFTLGLFIIL